MTEVFRSGLVVVDDLKRVLLLHRIDREWELPGMDNIAQTMTSAEDTAILVGHRELNVDVASVHGIGRIAVQQGGVDTYWDLFRPDVYIEPEELRIQRTDKYDSARYFFINRRNLNHRSLIVRCLADRLEDGSVII